MGVWADPNLCSAYGDTSQACVSETVASTCRQLQATGCVELIVAESCPVQLSCLRSVCPATGPDCNSADYSAATKCTRGPAPNTACSANGLRCALTTYTCPGTSKPITNSWAECHGGSWRSFMAKIGCPEPEPEPVCPATEPAPNTACSANGLKCTLRTYTCPGTSTPITTSWAECHGGSWRIALATPACPKPEPEPKPAVNVGAIAGGVIGGCAVLVIAILAWYVTVFRRTRQKTPAATPEHAPDIKLSKTGSKA